MSTIAGSSLSFPYPEAPEPGSLIEVAPGILWLRLALPFALNHVNVYLFEDGDGWTALDTGIGDDMTRAIWERVFAGRLHGRKLRRIIGTHYHPDHVGLVGWLGEKFDLGLQMSRTDYLFTMLLTSNRDAIHSPAHLEFYERNGLTGEPMEAVLGRGLHYLQMTTGMPQQYERLVAGQSLDIGGRRFEVSTGGGHAPEQVMLLCRDERLFFPADQVLARISPNVSVWAWEPDADPLAEYIASLTEIGTSIPEDALVLAAHNLPFRGIARRTDELRRHHRERCDRIADACRVEPLTGAEIVPVLFHRPLNAHETSFAFGEVMAHLNYMLGRGELLRVGDASGARRMRAA